MYDPTQHTIGFGKKLEWSDVEAMTGAITLFGTTDINLPEAELETAEFTNDNSPNRHKEYKPALYEPGTVSFTYIYATDEYAKVALLFALASVAETVNSAIKWFRVTLPDGATAKFQGFVTKNDVSAEISDAVEVEAEIQVTGPTEYEGPVVQG